MLIKLGQILHPEDLALAQEHFPLLDVAEVEFEFEVQDGPGGVLASVPNCCQIIKFDISDWPQDENGKLILNDLNRQALYHELVHIEQRQRGWWYQLRRWFWRNILGQTDQWAPDEDEAYERSKLMMATEGIKPPIVRSR